MSDRTKEITVGDKKMTLQKPSTQWFLETVDESKDRNGNPRSTVILKRMLENIVVEPADLKINDLTINEAEILQNKVGRFLRTDTLD